jgi:hypothetical protein
MNSGKIELNAISMKKTVFIVFTLFMINLSTYGQSGWVTINSSRGGFSFLFPQPTAPYDTLGLLTYSTEIAGDSEVLFQVNFIDSVYISGNEDLNQYIKSRFGNRSTRNTTGRTGPETNGQPGNCYVDSIEAVLVTYAQTYQTTTQGTIEGFVSSDYFPCKIRGKELTISHPALSGDGDTEYFVFTRYFYWESKFLAFTVFGPKYKLGKLSSYKKLLFESINIITSVEW